MRSILALVQCVGVQPGEQVLDLCAGTGNSVIPAAVAGGRVIGLDITPELFEDARKHAAEAGVEVEWVEGDAEELPFEDGRFDVVLSTFGCICVSRHEVAAREQFRVLRQGGRFGFAAMTATMGRYLPPPPAFASPPPLWGDEAHLRELFSGVGIELAFERGTAHIRDESIAGYVERGSTILGPLVKARELLEPQGRGLELRADLEQWARNGNTATDGKVDLLQEYLVTLGRRGEP